MTDLEVEAMRRIAEYSRSVSVSIESVSLIMEMETTRQRSPSDIQSLIAHFSEGELSEEQHRQVTERLTEVASRPTTDRFILHFDNRGHYRYERFETAIDYSEFPDIGESPVGYTLVQGDEEHWYVNHHSGLIKISHRRVEPGEMLSFLANGWQECNIHLNWQELILVLGAARGIAEARVVDGIAECSVTTDPDSPLGIQTYEITFNPEDDTALIDRMLVVFAPTRSVVECQLGDWTMVGQGPRPMRITRTLWRDVEGIGPEFDAERYTATATPDKRTVTTALQLSLNEPVDPDLFTYEPSPRLEIFEEQEDGSYVLVHDPVEGDPRVPVPAVSTRQRRIQERVAQATAPARNTLWLGIAGGAILLLGLGLLAKRALTH